MTMELVNRTPLVAAWNVTLGKDAAESLCVAARGTWGIDERGGLELLEEQPPYQPVDACVGEPGVSSVRYEADTGEMKPATDCALVGSAMGPRGRRVKAVDVAFRVGPVAKRARVVGERRRVFWLLRWWTSGPRAFQKVPLLWELAAGGTDATPVDEKRHAQDLRNPYGRGFRARGSKLPVRGSALPQVLPAGGRGPAGFGLTGPQWAHRKPFAGTYDDAWRENRCPLLPEDFDERFHLAAAPGLSTPEHLAGGEPVEVRGCTPSGRLAFTLPRARVRASATLDAGPEPVEMKLVTVTVDTDLMHLRLLWRGAIRVHGRLPKLARIEVKAEGLA